MHGCSGNGDSRGKKEKEIDLNIIPPPLGEAEPTKESRMMECGGKEGKEIVKKIDLDNFFSRTQEGEPMAEKGMQGCGGGDDSNGKEWERIAEEVNRSNSSLSFGGKESVTENDEGSSKDVVVLDMMHTSSRRKKSASDGENAVSISEGQGSGDRKRPTYHCNYCNIDISGCIRIKCAICSDFDLCVECFSVGAEVYPHKSTHPYQVMDSLSFPLICPEWNAEEEMLLLEGLDMYGMGNWIEVAKHVDSKSKEACIDHYENYYLKSPCFPLPDMTHTVVKNPNVLAMVKGNPKDKKEEMSGRSFGGTILNVDANFEELSLVDSSGYNPKRQEFDVEYDNDAEQLLVDMEFKETDNDMEREIKLRVLRIYNQRLDERKRRKDFFVERNLFQPSEFQKGLSQEEIQLTQPYYRYMLLFTKEEFEEVMQIIVSEHRSRKRLADLKEAQAAGCRTVSQADRYVEQKRRAAMDCARSQAGPSSPSVPVLSSDSRNQTNSASHTDFDSASISAADLLSKSEKQLCHEVQLAPPQYLKLQAKLAAQILIGNIKKKSDAHSLFQVEPNVIDRVYDMLAKKGITPQ